MTINATTSTLQTLMALFENENKAAGGSAALTKDQISTIETMLKGDGTSGTATSTTGGTTSLSAILDQIEAKTSDGSATTETATTPQQKAAAMMQSIYQSQQTNLFTLIG